MDNFYEETEKQILKSFKNLLTLFPGQERIRKCAEGDEASCVELFDLLKKDYEIKEQKTKEMQLLAYDIYKESTALVINQMCVMSHLLHSPDINDVFQTVSVINNIEEHENNVDKKAQKMQIIVNDMKKELGLKNTDIMSAEEEGCFSNKNSIACLNISQALSVAYSVVNYNTIIETRESMNKCMDKKSGLKCVNIIEKIKAFND